MSLSPGRNLSLEAPRLLLRARGVLPMAGPPLRDGAVLVAGTDILAVGRWKDLKSSPHQTVLDLGDALIAPGLINAHCHLDYTDMAGQISPLKSFSDWIKAMLSLKAHWTYSDYAASWLRGARMLLRHGVTTVADIEAVPELLPEVLSATPLRVCSLLELTGVRSRRAPAQIVTDAEAHIAALGTWAGLSPHAPYSTTPELLRLAAETARRRRWLVATHVAESREEFDMISSAAGPMFDWLQTQRDMSDCGVRSPVEHLQAHGVLGPNLLAIHVNYLAARDATLLAQTGTSVVHCPRSHAYFRHRSFPRARLMAAGVNLCVGTDSLASVRLGSPDAGELDLWTELRAMADQHSALPPETLLRFATINGARAVGQAGKLGELSPGSRADLIVLPARRLGRDPYATALGHTGPVSAVMINGRWATKPLMAA